MNQKYRDMLQRARRSPHGFQQRAWREYQTGILQLVKSGSGTYAQSAQSLGLSTQRYLAFLRHNNPTLETMSIVAAAQGKRIRIVVEPIE